MDMSRRLSPDRIVFDLASAGEPQLSPDGSTIVYSRSQAVRGRKRPVSHLWRIDRDGGNPRQLTNEGSKNGGARWSPDGSLVAYVSDSGEGNGIFVASPDSWHPRLLTSHRANPAELAWSPDGRSIAYVAAFDADNPDEAEPGEEAAPPVRVVRRIDYKQENRGFLNDVRHQVWVVDVDSGERRRLTGELLDHSCPA